MPYEVSDDVQERFAALVETIPSIPSFCSTLRGIVFQYAAGELKFGLPADFDKFLLAVNDLITILESVPTCEVVE